MSEGAPGVVPLGHAIPPKRAPARYLLAVLIARIYEVFPLLCPLCGGQMRLIAFITGGTQIRRILDNIGVDSEPPHISPARGPGVVANQRCDTCLEAVEMLIRQPQAALNHLCISATTLPYGQGGARILAVLVHRH